MKTSSMRFSRLLNTLAFGALISVGICYTSTTDAAQGCGFGYHMTAFGRCVPNSPGPNATPVPGRPDCWRKGDGALRCYR